MFRLRFKTGREILALFVLLKLLTSIGAVGTKAVFLISIGVECWLLVEDLVPVCLWRALSFFVPSPSKQFSIDLLAGCFADPRKDFAMFEALASCWLHYTNTIWPSLKGLLVDVNAFIKPSNTVRTIAHLSSTLDCCCEAVVMCLNAFACGAPKIRRRSRLHLRCYTGRKTLQLNSVCSSNSTALSDHDLGSRSSFMDVHRTWNSLTPVLRYVPKTSRRIPYFTSDRWAHGLPCKSSKYFQKTKIILSPSISALVSLRLSTACHSVELPSFSS